jgi:thioesterase domain-containing protein
VPDQYRVSTHRLRSAVLQYRATPLAGKITIFRANRQPIGIYPDRTLGWKGLAAEIEILDVPGFHANIVSEPRVKFLVEKLQIAMDLAHEECRRLDARKSQSENPVEIVL